MPRPEPDVRPGVVIADKYRVEKELGRGGFGIVVKAHHLTLDQAVAIKVLTEGEGSDTDWEEDAARFRREAMATAALKGDHVVRVLDIDVLPSGCPYIVMEYLEGQTLHEIVHTRGPLPIAEAIDIAIQVLAALAEAHGLGIVHRDLKPANVFIAHAGAGTSLVKVLDFGVSKMLESRSKPITRTGALIGTVAYMSPEQMLDAKRVDGRADLWSVALILYEALSRKLPFGESSSPTVVTAILGQPPIPLAQFRPDLPPALIAAIMRLLEKIPEQRFSTALEAATALAPFASPHSRFAFDAIRRAPPPQGAAAPLPSGMVPTTHGRVQKVSTAPPRTSPSVTPQPQKKKSSALWLILSFALAGAVLGVITAITFITQPRWLTLPKKDPAASSASVAPPAASSDAPPVASPSALVVVASAAPPAPSASVSSPTVGHAPTSPKPTGSPKATAAAAASSAKNPCDPPYVFDHETNIKKYKPECL